MIKIIFGIVQFLVLLILTPFALGYFMHITGLTDDVSAVIFLTIWIYGVVIGYGAWFHVWTITSKLEEKNVSEISVETSEA